MALTSHRIFVKLNLIFSIKSAFYDPKQKISIIGKNHTHWESPVQQAPVGKFILSGSNSRSHQVQKFIQNPVSHLRCSVLQK